MTTARSRYGGRGNNVLSDVEKGVSRIDERDNVVNADLDRGSRATKSKWSSRKITVLALICIGTFFVIFHYVSPFNPTMKNILIVHETLPLFDELGSDARIVSLVEKLSEKGFKVFYAYRYQKTDLKQKYMDCLTNAGADILGPLEKYKSPDPQEMLNYDHEVSDFDYNLEETLHLIKMDVAILFQWYWYWPQERSVTEVYAPIIRQASPSTKVVVLSDDVHYLREKMLAEATQDPEMSRRVEKMKQAEFRDLISADYVLCATEDDAVRLKNWIPSLQIGLFPYSVQTGDDGEKVPEFGERSHLLFVGGPNLVNMLAVKWFLGHVWPQVRESNPDIEFHIAGTFWGGKDLDSLMKHFHGPNMENHEALGIKVLGHIPESDIEELYGRYRIFVSPITTGTGINTKNVAAMMNYVPVITTPIGAEGFGQVNDNIMIVRRAEPAEFIETIWSLYNNATYWSMLSVSGRNHIKVQFAEEAVDRHIDTFIKDMSSFEKGEKSKNVMVVHVSSPLPDQKGSDKRLYQILKGLHSQGHYITYVGWKIEEGQTPEHTEELRKFAQTVVPDMETKLDPHKGCGRGTLCEFYRTYRIPDFICERKYDVAIFFFWITKPYWMLVEEFVANFRAYSPSTHLVILTDDVNFERQEMLAASTRSAWIADYATVLAPAELHTWTIFDSIYTVTDEDAERIMTHMSGVKPVNVLHFVSDRIPVPDLDSFSTRKGFAFVGYCNDANRESLEWFFRTVFPLIQERIADSSATFKIVGTVGSRECYEGYGSSLGLEDGVEWVGYVPNVNDVLSTVRVFLSPMQSGTGINTKNLLALENGVPLVTTSVGGRSLFLDGGNCLCGVIENEGTAFAENAVRLHENRLDWEEASTATVDHVKKYFSDTVINADVRKLIGSLKDSGDTKMSNLCQNRNKLLSVYRRYPGS